MRLLKTFYSADLINKSTKNLDIFSPEDHQRVLVETLSSYLNCNLTQQISFSRYLFIHTVWPNAQDITFIHFVSLCSVNHTSKQH